MSRAQSAILGIPRKAHHNTANMISTCCPSKEQPAISNKETLNFRPVITSSGRWCLSAASGGPEQVSVICGPLTVPVHPPSSLCRRSLRYAKVRSASCSVDLCAFLHQSNARSSCHIHFISDPSSYPCSLTDHWELLLVSNLGKPRRCTTAWALSSGVHTN
jgi:hypothetical protein